MKVKRTNIRPIIRPLNIKKVAVLWCDDGWSYIPLLKIRRIFISNNNTFMIYNEEPWDTSIASKVLYEEVIVWTDYSMKPRLWSETGEAETSLGFTDCFEEIA